MTAKHLTDTEVELSVHGSVTSARVRIQFGSQILLLDFADALQLADDLVDTVETTRRTKNRKKAKKTQ
ncbi:hypothetical protein CH260_10365 [Rhodococcus sp. 05-2256-B2]|uniref:hypothetical protein n=1 Tax=unclassified Rhodococcus (in: high G+C Gram-positive bacteria) TaxID=192944 RepID=UPI000B9A8D9B|nr:MULTISPECIES: hypothetical protein [unclassified Rhodococcus (in: high G+C Gram-positive bacteria)]OZD81820.1 hypothetical protein CH258_19815 [Rhodococcus sp. 05-2256-B4]OZD90441.1 hypothetical protein CH257_18210 [Rhodococcus sp. 05-2256-B3]OZD96935.1 hypothetical protein CH260_10365 [Rhodococcus sp. 05-2256-B2]OZE00443.1 hypothetical protein CH285_19460 [Rhodococcus sp. 05-2256-B1]